MEDISGGDGEAMCPACYMPVSLAKSFAKARVLLFNVTFVRLKE